MTKEQLRYKCSQCKVTWPASEDEKAAIKKYYDEKIASKKPPANPVKPGRIAKEHPKPAVMENTPPSNTSQEKPKPRKSLFDWEGWL